jgi:UDP-GlcNAc:undecaprenyl-phosphate GlcNAc-1-phosphate transferase
MDRPTLERKIHEKAIPFLGGLAIFLSFFIVLFLNIDKVLAGNLELKHWLGVFIGASLLMIGGILDDKYSLKPSKQLIWPILAIISVIAAGVGINKITNPFGGIIDFEKLVYLPYILTFLWLLGMMYTTKLLDGLDGLVTGISAIGGLIIFLFTITTKYYQPDIAFASLIFSGACLGFLIFNFNPAKVFLGEGGSLLLGFLLGILSIISGGKIAIALLVIGLPVLDAGWTIVRRLLKRQNPFSHSDKLHLHFRLLNRGLGQKKTVLLYYLIAIFFGLSGLFLQSIGKIFALVILFIVMLVLVIGSTFLGKKNEK